jgi:hypothetical protein
MTRRYTSGFDILGFDTDPTPGDPDLIMSQIVPTYQSIGDDAEAALNALNSNAIESGSGQTMQALQNLIGTSFPPKLQTAADSYHSAASIYSAYAQALTEAQNQLDQAMDQAMPVAAMANATVPPAPPNASADQVAAVQQQQQSVNQANDQLTAAMRLGQDAADMRNQAGNTFNTNLNDVSAIPDLSAWQKFLDWFEHNPIIQIIVDVAIAIVSIFCPVVGLVLGLLAFTAFTAFNTAYTGHFDYVGALIGLATLAVGGGAAFKGAELFAKFSGSLVKTGKGIGNFLHLSGGSTLKGILNSTKAVLGKADSALSSGLGKTGASFVKNAAGNFALDSAIGFAGNGIEDVAHHEQFTGQDAEAILAGAAAGGIVGGAAGAAKTGLGYDPVTPSPDSSGPADTALAPSADPGQTPPSVPPKGPRPMPTPSADPGETPPLVSPKDPGQMPPSATETIGNAISQGGNIGNDLANGGVQIAVGQALGNTTGAQQNPPGTRPARMRWAIFQLWRTAQISIRLSMVLPIPPRASDQRRMTHDRDQHPRG